MFPMIGGQRNISSALTWPGGPPPPSLPVLGFFGLGSQPHHLQFFNQENLPVAPTPLWNPGWNLAPQVGTPPFQCSVGRPILGRRNDPNQHESAINGNSISGCQALEPLFQIGEDIDRGIKRSRTPSPLDNWSQNNNQVTRKCINPPTISVLGVNTSIPPPPIVNLPRKESEHFFHPISQTTCNPVELHVTNLDQSIDLREMKKLLMSAFREHVMVLHVAVFVQSDGTLAASVRVPSMQDAQYAISQLHRRKVGFKRIMIAHAHSTSPQNPHFIKSQIVSLLLEVPSHKMPLFTFRELFASRFLTSVSVSDLYRMRDVCIIMEENSGRTISLNPEYRNTPSPVSSTEGIINMEMPYCTRHSQQLASIDKGWAEQEHPNLANVRVRLTELSERVTSLVTSHDNYLPLASLMDCYSAQFEALTVDEQSVPLEHLITCINGVELAHSGSNKHLRLCPQKLVVDNKSDDSLVCVSPPLANQVNLFARELVDLLKMQPHCQLLFNRFIPAYHHHFGRQCRVADYGFTKLIDLLETLPHVVQVMGEGNKRMVTLSHRAQVRRFTSDLLRVLKSQASKQLMVSELDQMFERVLGRPFDPVDYGLCYLEDLLSQLSANIVLVSKEGDEMTIAIPKREQTPEEIERTKQFAVQVVKLLSHTPQCSMEFSKFIPAYHHHYGSQCRVADFGFSKLIELFEAIPQVVKIDEEGEGMRQVSLTQPEKLKVLASRLLGLALSKYPPGLKLSNLNSAYLWQYGYPLKPSVYGYDNLLELLNKLTTIKVITSEDGSSIITPVDQSQGRILRLRTLRIMWEKSDAKMKLDEFEQAFLKYYQQSCGRQTIETDLQDVVEISEDTLVLNPIQEFAREVYRLLCACDGRMALTYFDVEYQRSLGKSLSPAQFGYQSTLALLQAINHVVTITGRGNKKFVILHCDLAAVGIFCPRTLIKNGNIYDIAESCHHSDISNHRNTSQSLLKGVHLKVNEERTKQEGVWSTLWYGKHKIPSNGNVLHTNNNFEQPTVIHLPEPRTPPSKEECMALLSPAKFLLPASAFPFLPSPPDPSELPKPDHFNLTQVNQKGEHGRNLASGDSESHNQTKRKLRLAAHFQSPIQLK